MFTESHKAIAREIWQAIAVAKNILLHCHPSPDGDSVGSSLSMYHALKSIGKSATLIWGDSGLTSQFSFVPGFDEIVAKNFFEVDLSQYDLFIALDSGSIDMISKKGEVKIPDHMKSVVIDHHASNTRYGDINLVVDTYPATAQVNYELFSLWNIAITREIAQCLILGMFTDTGGFKYRGVTSRTFEIMAALSRIEPEFDRMISELENNNEYARVVFMGMALHSIKMFFNNRVAISIVTHDQLLQNNIPEEATHKQGVANTLKSIRGVEVGVQCTEIAPDVVKFSFRSRDGQRFDVSALAVALGGGGHKAAAATVVKMPLAEAVPRLCEVMKQLYPDLA